MAMRHGMTAFLATLGACATAIAAPMKARVIQPLFAPDRAGLDKSFQWTLDELDKCDETLDLVVLPEFSEVPGSTPTRDDFFAAVRKYGPKLVEACSKTAKRCHALVFTGAIESTGEWDRNVIFGFNREGEIVSRYYKQQVTAGERDRYKLDVSYTREWSKPYTVEIEGLKFAFLTCYDFYYYENFANIARQKPDIIIGCSHQRSDLHHALDMIDTFCAYNTGAYLVRASVSMGESSPVGGCSSVVSPKGVVLGNLYSKVGVTDVTFDPKAKYLKPMGYGNPPGLHSDYIEIGRRPWKYRPGGSAIVPPISEAAAKRLCAHRGFCAVAPENSLPAYGAAVALGAGEIEFDLWWTKDGEIVSCHDETIDRVSDGTGKVTEKTYAELSRYDFGMKEKGPSFRGLKILRFKDILEKFSCHTIFNIHVKMNPGEEGLVKMIDMIRAYDADKHVYFMTSDDGLQKDLARLAPDIPRVLGYKDGRECVKHVEDAVRLGCWGLQLYRCAADGVRHFDEATFKAAKAAGLHINVFWSDDAEETKKYFEMGADTVLTNDYQPIASETGLK